MTLPSKEIDLSYSQAVEPDILQNFFISHLNRVYCAKTHLLERLPEVRDHAHFQDLKQAIAETMEDIENQIGRMETIFGLLNAKFLMDSCDGVMGAIEDAFTAIHNQSDNPHLRDLSILFYLSNIESMEMTSFDILQIAAAKLENREVGQLLKENFEEAKGDHALFLFITTRYMNL